MNTNIFYSWQSDLPNNSNRSFIESCIKEATKQLRKITPFSIDACIDRDTKDEPGTPDIIKTIFNKIEKAKIFIADISIISCDSENRKTPNPNVLIELGYAAKVLGWEKVICIYNSDYGCYEDLPFDIRHRRPLVYSLKGNEKHIEKKKIAGAIKDTIVNLDRKGLLVDELHDYLKTQIDTQILTILKDLINIVNGYEGTTDFFKKINVFLNLDKEKISSIIKSNEFLGFQVFKKYEYCDNEIRNLLDKAMSYACYEREVTNVLIKMIKIISSFDKFNRLRVTPDLFFPINKCSNEFKVINGSKMNPQNEKYPERYILLKNYNEDKFVVTDFGDFQEKDNVVRLLEYFSINEKYIADYTSYVSSIIGICNRWLDMTGGEFIIDDIKQFEIRKPKTKN